MEVIKRSGSGWIINPDKIYQAITLKLRKLSMFWLMICDKPIKWQKVAMDLDEAQVERATIVIWSIVSAFNNTWDGLYYHCKERLRFTRFATWFGTERASLIKYSVFAFEQIRWEYKRSYWALHFVFSWKFRKHDIIEEIELERKWDYGNYSRWTVSWTHVQS